MVNKNKDTIKKDNKNLEGKNNIFICLDNLRSLYNIGAIMRTCSFFGIKNLILLGYSGKTNFKNNKVDNTNEVILHKEILKTSLGSEKDLNIIFMENSKDLINFSLDNKLKIISLEQNINSIDFEIWNPKDNSIIVFGNEVEGVNPNILSQSHQIVEIKRMGKHNSLNVEASASIVINKISKQ